MQNKKHFVKQSGYKDCASASLLTIMNYYGFNTSLDEVSYVLKTNNSGTNALNIINGCKYFGFDGYGIHYSYDEIINNKVNMPIICHTIKNNMYHFIVVFSSNKKYLIVNDPSSNINRISHEYFKKIYLNTSLVIYPVKIQKNTIKSKSLCNFIFDYIKLEKNTIIKNIIISFIYILLSILTNYYLLIILDVILPQYNYKLFLVLTICFLNIYIIKNLLYFIREKSTFKIEKNLYKKINLNIINSIFNLPYNFFKSKSTSEIQTRIDDIKIIKTYLSKIIVTISMDTTFIIVSSIILLNINIKLFIISLIEILLYFLVYLLFKNNFIIKSEEVLESESEYNKELYESINGYEVNRNLNNINEQNKKVEISFIKYVNKINNYENLTNKELLLKNIITDVFYVTSIFIGIRFVIDNDITLGNFILFNSILYYFSEPIKNMIELKNNLIYLKTTYRRMNDILLFKRNKSIVKKQILKKDIIINNLSYSINGIDYLFENINLEIKYGDKILIYGKSGSGKSTLIKIILKYLSDYKGNIYFDNINLKDMSDYIISDNFTYVSQNSFINNDTLINNIIINKNISEDEYERVINICNLNTFRDSKFNRNNFVIEEDGFNISGGERQKIILARSLLKNSNYIVLDEALSEVGFDEEKEIINKILEYYNDKTIIYISHKKEIIDLFTSKYKLERSCGYAK